MLSRIIKVKGRINCLNNSIKGKRAAKAKGEPYGNKWAIKAFSCVKETTTIRESQIIKEKVAV